MLKNRKLNRWTLAGAFALTTTALTLAIPAVRSQSPSIVKIDGSSTVYPITEAVAEEFQAEKRGSLRVTVGISGTGGGFKKFCNGQTDISNASRPIKASEKEQCAASGIEYIELPVAYDALTVVVHPENNAVNTITVEELKKMWGPEATNTVVKWNQVNPSWPDEPLRLLGPGADSGTFDYFTEVINGKSGASRTDYTPSEDDNILVQGVLSDKNSIAYFGFAYYEANKNKLKSLAIDDGNGPVKPSLDNVINGTYTPLSRPIFIYVNAKAAERSEVKEFVEYYLNNAPTLVAEVNYVPLTSSEYSQGMQRFQNRIVGSAQ